MSRCVFGALPGKRHLPGSHIHVLAAKLRSARLVVVEQLHPQGNSGSTLGLMHFISLFSSIGHSAGHKKYSIIISVFPDLCGHGKTMKNISKTHKIRILSCTLLDISRNANRAHAIAKATLRIKS